MLTTSIVLLASSLVISVQSGGKLEIQFDKYKNSASKDYKGYCCETFTTFWCINDCDNYFDVCYREYTPAKDDKCIATRRTGEFDDDHTFSTGSKALGNNLDNPFSFSFSGSWKNSFSLKITIWDSDSSTGDDLVDYLRAGISHAGVSSSWTSLTLSGKHGKTLAIKWRVRCDANYYGDCSVLCMPPQTNPARYKCDPTTGRIICINGWTGSPKCNIPICKTGCSSDRGYCLQPNECICYSGWTGKTCSQCVPKSGCANGYCINGGDCICRSHWMGPLCDQDGSGCTGAPCRNGGTCSVIPNGFTCSCPADYTGSNCALDMNRCRSSPCYNNATCRSLPNRFVCDCMPGFTGKICSTEINECLNDPCLYGDCVDYLNGFSCTCHPGFTGRLCATDIDECLADLNDCGANTICENTLGGHSCKCQSGYRDASDGNSCELIQCSSLDYLPDSTFVTFSHNDRGVGSVALIVCVHGYVMNGSSPLRLRCLGDGTWDGDPIPCADVDECLLGESCRSDEVCRNTDGSYECTVQSEIPNEPKNPTEAPGTVCGDVDTVDCIRGGGPGNPDEVSGAKKGSSLGLYIGIAAGCLLLLVILVVVVIVCRRRGKRVPQLDPIPEPEQMNNNVAGAVAAGCSDAAAVAAKLKNIEDEPIYDAISDVPAATNEYEDMSGLHTIRFVNTDGEEPGFSLTNPAYGVRGTSVTSRAQYDHTSTWRGDEARESAYNHPTVSRESGGNETGESEYEEPSAGKESGANGSQYDKMRFS